MGRKKISENNTTFKFIIPRKLLEDFNKAIPEGENASVVLRSLVRTYVERNGINGKNAHKA